MVQKAVQERLLSNLQTILGAPLREGLMLIHNTLVDLSLRDKLKIIASGKLVSAFGISRVLALGADACNMARGFMFALGCIQAQACHTGKCPTGVTSQDPSRYRALDVNKKIYQSNAVPPQYTRDFERIHRGMRT